MTQFCRKNQGRLRLGKWGTPTLTEEIKYNLKHTFLPLLPDSFPLLSFPSFSLPFFPFSFLHHSLHPCLSPPGATLLSDSTPSLLALLADFPSEQTSYVSNPFTAILLWLLRWMRLCPGCFRDWESWDYYSHGAVQCRTVLVILMSVGQR